MENAERRIIKKKVDDDILDEAMRMVKGLELSQKVCF